MTRLKAVLGLICALVALSAIAASAASANTICGGPAPARTAPSSTSPIYGWMANGTTFQVWERAVNGFFHGWAFGGINHEAYVSGNYLC